MCCRASVNSGEPACGAGIAMRATSGELGSGGRCSSSSWTSPCASSRWRRASEAKGFSRWIAANRCPASERTIPMVRESAWKLAGANGTLIPVPASIIPLATKNVSA